MPATEGNAVDVLRNGDQIFPAMLEAIDQAEHTIDFLTFVYWTRRGRPSSSASHLAERAEAGVRVRVLLDAWGAAHHGQAVLARLDGTPAPTSTGSGRCDGSAPARSTTAPTARC